MFKTLSYFSIMAVGALGLASCASQELPDISLEDAKVMATVKPGASLSFTSTSPKNLGVSEIGRVKITISDGYDNGTLSINAVPEDGLRFVSETGRTEFSMASVEAHEWELDVMASAKGVYYINVFAEALTPQNPTPQFRSYAVRVQVGDLTDAELKGSLKTNGRLSTDGTVVVMEAEEIIK